MSQDNTMNPYAAPTAELNTPTASGEIKFTEAKKLTAGEGVAIISDSWALFKKAPIKWIVAFALFFFIMMACNLIPIAGLIFSIFLPTLLSAGLHMGANDLSQGNAFRIGHLFAGFKQRAGALMGLALLYYVVMIVVMLSVFAMFGGVEFFVSTLVGSEQDPETLMNAYKVFGLAYLVGLALLLPVMAANWFAIPLMVFQNEGVFSALGKSFKACFKNIIPLTIYSIVLLLLVVVSMIPLGLGLLITMPMAFITIYTGYRRIFTEM